MTLKILWVQITAIKHILIFLLVEVLAYNLWKTNKICEAPWSESQYACIAIAIINILQWSGTFASWGIIITQSP